LKIPEIFPEMANAHFGGTSALPVALFDSMISETNTELELVQERLRAARAAQEGPPDLDGLVLM
jgi:hypothetical protein